MAALLTLLPQLSWTNLVPMIYCECEVCGHGQCQSMVILSFPMYKALFRNDMVQGTVAPPGE